MAHIILLILLATGCAKDQNRIVIPKDAARMAVAFSWSGIEPCTHESPLIQVDDIPDGTIAFQVTLRDTALPAWNHGGGRVENDGSGIIPAGALNLGYNGPCTPPGKRHKYEISVMALDDNGEIIGFGKSSRPYPPKE